MIGSEKPWGDGEYAIAHLSDLHFGSPHYREVWALTAQFLTEMQPELLLITGDLVDTPRKALYEEVKASLDSLRIPYFVCAGNHDRFYMGNQLPPWTRRIVGSGLVLLVMLIGGALLWKWAWSWGWGLVLLFALGAAWNSRNYVVWLWTRLRVDDHFSEVFQSKILIHEELTLLKVPRAPSGVGGVSDSRWTIGLFGDDSNASADASARGYLPSTHFLPIRKATEGQDCELCLFLVHHHLLSIRRLEEDRFNKIGALFDLTNIVNAGSLLETLSAAHVDLVLHGHEHEHNFAAYGSLTTGSETVKVIAAGSATGNRTLQGCIKQQATFNVLVLGLDRSVALGRYWRDAERWRWEDVDQIDAASLRHNRLRRVHRLTGHLISEITKFIEFTRQRDIWVYWVYTNWVLPSDEFSQEVVNSTGVVDEKARVRISVPPSPPRDLETTIERVAGKPNTWQIRAPVPAGFSGRRVQLELVYCWRDGAILTDEEMKQTAASRQESGTPRSRGYEFVTGWTSPQYPVRALDVVVSLPQEYAPVLVGTEPEVEVCVELDGRRIVHQEIELRPHLRTLGKGVIALRIEYPQGGYDYQIAWKSVPQWMVNRLMDNDGPRRDFGKTARLRGNELLKSFRKQLKKSSFPDCSSVALYVPPENGEPNLDRVACIDWKGDSEPPCEAMPPRLIPLIGGQQLLARAWCGEPFVVFRPSDRVQAHRSGFLTNADPKLDESVVFGVPIRLSLRSINPPPWGVVRIGVTGSDQKLQDLDNVEKLSTILLAAATILLSATLDTDYNQRSPSQ